jgi:phosphohistidine phosphatase
VALAAWPSGVAWAGRSRYCSRMTDRRGKIELYLLRHADAGDPEAWTRPDAERPLSAKGRRQAERLGRHLAAVEFAPDAILTSPKVRAAETAGLVAEALGRPVEEDERLAGPLGIDTLEAILTDAGSARRIVLVGHDPDFSEVLTDLVGAPGLSMRKGALARIDLDGSVEPGGGVLRWLLPPDLLPSG